MFSNRKINEYPLKSKEQLNSLHTSLYMCGDAVIEFIEAIEIYAKQIHGLKEERDNLDSIINSEKFHDPFACYVANCMIPWVCVITVFTLLNGFVFKLGGYPCQINHEKYSSHISPNNACFNVSANSTTLLPITTSPQKICYDSILNILIIGAFTLFLTLVGVLYSCCFAFARTRMRNLNNKPLELISLEHIRTDIKHIFTSIVIPYLIDINKISEPDNETSTLDICINGFFSEIDEESTNDNDSSSERRADISSLSLL